MAKMLVGAVLYFGSIMFLDSKIVANWTEGIYKKYEATWESLDKREIPAWYEEAKVGMLIHWGVHAVPSFHSERFYEAWQIKNKIDPKVVQFMNKNYPKNFTYQQFGSMFKAEFFDSNRITELLVQSGAKYAVVVAKHHDGFCMWPSSFSANWHVGAVGPKRDLLLEMINTIRRNSDLYVGLLYSMMEWPNATLMFQLNNPETKPQTIVKDKIMPELFYLSEHYRPDLIRGGGNWLADSTYYKSESFLQWLYNESPVKDVVVVNDQWGRDTFCKHGGYYQCDNIINQDNNKSVHKFENVVSIDKKSWSYRREATADDYMSVTDIIKSLVVTVCAGGNVLFSFGLTKEGFIPSIIEHRLQQLGRWLQINGEAIYGTRPWIFTNDSITNDVWYTSRRLLSSTVVYAIFFHWPANNVLQLASLTPYWATSVKMLVQTDSLDWSSSGEGMLVKLKAPSADSWATGKAWTLRIKCLKMYAKSDRNSE